MSERSPNSNRLSPKRLLAIGAMAVGALAPNIYAVTGTSEHQDQQRAVQMLELDGELALGAGMVFTGAKLVEEARRYDDRS